MFRIVAGALLAPIVLAAAPALAHERAHSPQQVTAALNAGCTVQHVHTPAGKIVQQPAIVHCPKARAIETASREPARPQGQRSEVE